MEWRTILIFIGVTLLYGIICISGITSAIEVTRVESGDIFTNPNPSCSPDSCRSYQGQSLFGVYHTKCKCACSGDKTTYTYGHHTCVDRKYLELSLASTGKCFSVSVCVEYVIGN